MARKQKINELISNGIDFLNDAYYPEDVVISDIQINTAKNKSEAIFSFENTPIQLASEKQVYWFIESRRSGYYTSYDYFELFDQLEIINS